jgi:hypothetical protein
MVRRKSMRVRSKRFESKVTKDDIFNSLPTIKDCMEAEGLTPTNLAQRLKEEMDYEEPVLVTVADENGKTKKVLTRMVTPAAMSIRQRGRMQAHRFRNDYPPEKKRRAGPAGGPSRIAMG